MFKQLLDAGRNMSTPQWALQQIEKAQMTKAKHLNLSRSSPRDSNKPLSVLPNEIFKLSWVESLSINNSELHTLPGEIAELKNLTALNLRRNKITSLPKTLSDLQNLKTLILNANHLNRLPDAITQLQNLEVLDLGKNNLVSLPSDFSNLKNLIALNLGENKLKVVADEVFQLQKLRSLNLSGNPLVTPPLEIALRGIVAVREYFRQIYEEGEDFLYEAKLLILGEGGAGKTTLAEKIKNSTYKLRDEKSTEGVDVFQWSFLTDEQRPFRLNIWDFGGQEIYHATHQFFLTKRSLYALVADTRKEDTDFYYWLSVVELLSDNSPLLIIKNEKQDRHREINERQLRGQFEILKAILPVNLATNRGLDNVIKEIKHYAKQLPHVGSPLPKTWIRVREFLESDPRPYISLVEYLEICKKNGFSDAKDSTQLSGYLHDIGVFLYFQDDPLLRKTVILKPKWGTDAAYKVLDNKGVIRNLGRFTRADLVHIWSGSEYINMHDELLQLMMKFKLCYQIPNSQSTYIAPQLLTENQPSYTWDEKDNLLLRYTYEFMPKGILMQFIVAMHPYITTKQNQTSVWKSGVVIAKNQTLAEIIEYYVKRQIRIRIAGSHKKELMSIVMHELDKIHFTYQRLKYDKLIPCNCVECKPKKEPYFYRYEILRKFIEDRQDQIQCQQSYDMVNVRGLIDDVFEKTPVHQTQESPVVRHTTVVYGDLISGGEKMMEKKNISISNSTIHGSVVAAESIKDSFNIIEKSNIKEDLKEQLKQLAQAVDTMIKELPKEQAEEAADDMKRLADEATKEKPSPRWYNVSIEGLIAAAQNLGKVADPVIELTGKVRKILTGGIL